MFALCIKNESDVRQAVYYGIQVVTVALGYYVTALVFIGFLLYCNISA
jgi:hypothetical protein